eukprot:TRINITY_DN4035_c0_g1_i1.p1 TRINITY_DN4035_c0_g1~~TRINITY_DN4035_c0_g1_i1.p1  ORF type:complete len:207 (+),score=26.81 TRINITY_DN4035_c0_g1_i1:175-795(+)
MCIRDRYMGIKKIRLMQTNEVIPRINTDYREANVEVAEKHAKKTILRQPNGEFYPVCETSPENFKVSSLGLMLYFFFVKEMFIIFLVLTVFSIPPLIINYTGGYLNTVDIQTVFDSSTLANQRGIEYLTTSKDEAENALSNSKIYQYITVYCDVASCIIFILMVLFFRAGNHREELIYLKNNCTPCLLYTSPSPRDLSTSRMPSSA